MSTFDAKKSAEARDEAMAAAEDAASEHWKSEALKAVRTVAAMREEFTTDPVWYLLEKAGVPAPHEPRVLGSVMKKAASLNICQATDRTSQSVRVDCHRRPLRVYKSLLFQAPEAVAVMAAKP